MIEDFMIAANETVAEHVFYMGLPFVYRVHEVPDNEKVEELIRVSRMLKYKIDTYDDHLAKALSGALTGENAEKMWEIDYSDLKNEQQPVII